MLPGETDTHFEKADRGVAEIKSVTNDEVERPSSPREELSVIVLTEWVVVPEAGLSLVGRKLPPGTVETRSQVEAHLEREERQGF